MESGGSNYCKTSCDTMDGIVAITAGQFISLQPNVVFNMKTSHLIWAANQMTGFHIKCNCGLRWVNSTSSNYGTS